MKLLIAALFCLASLIGFSQSNYEDVVYLKNGSIIHGVIIEQVPNVSIKIKNKVGDIFFYKVEEVEKFTKEEVKSEQKRAPKEPATQPDEPVRPRRVFTFDSIAVGTTGTIEIGGVFGIQHTETMNGGYYSGAGGWYSAPIKVVIPNVNMFTIKITIDKMLNRRTSVGGGFGFDLSQHDPRNDIPSNPAFMLPAYFDVRYSFLKRKVSPYMAGQAGATFYLGRSSYNSDRTIGGGGLAALQVGVKGYVSRTTALSVSLGYRLQHLNYQDYEYTENGMEKKAQNTYLSFLSLLFGISF